MFTLKRTRASRHVPSPKGAFLSVHTRLIGFVTSLVALPLVYQMIYLPIRTHSELPCGYKLTAALALVFVFGIYLLIFGKRGKDFAYQEKSPLTWLVCGVPVGVMSGSLFCYAHPDMAHAIWQFRFW